MLSNEEILLLAAISLFGCTKENESVVITNLSGTDWHETQVWYGQSEKELEGYSEVGTVRIGQSCMVGTECGMMYIYAKDNRGRVVMSKQKDATSGSVTIKESDLF